MEFFQLALQGKVMLMYEYFLVGSVLDSAKDGLLEILRGLCDNPEQKSIEFFETEIDNFMRIKANPNGALVTLRARNVRNTVDGLQHSHLRYVGQNDLKLDKERKSMVRTYIDCLASPNLNDYLQMIGFNLDAELIMRGYLFHKGRLKVVISKVFTTSGSGEMQPLSQSHFVEISCVALAGQETVAEEVKKFGDLLKPYVKMEKLNQIMEQANSV